MLDMPEFMDEWDLARNCHLETQYLGRSLFGIVRKKGMCAPHTESSISSSRPPLGCPCKPKPDPHSYRKFNYNEDLNHPIPSSSETQILLIFIPIDEHDRALIDALAEQFN